MCFAHERDWKAIDSLSRLTQHANSPAGFRSATNQS